MRRCVWLVCLTGCLYPGRGPEPHGPKTPEAMTAINSPFDDFNAADPGRYYRRSIVFSTNRGSQGHDFDLYRSDFEWDRDGGKHTAYTATEPVPFAPELMTPADERGPNFLNAWEWDPPAADAGNSYFVLASTRGGTERGLDLFATECSTEYKGVCVPGAPLKPLDALNTTGDDAYLSKTFEARTVLFASNRGSGPMHIQQAHWDVRKTLLDPPASISPVAELAGDGEDTAPYVYRRDGSDRAEVVFTSTRSGGSGEHDLYCARFDAKHQRWSVPKNLGPAINSPSDEYRPIVIEVNHTRFLIFSSTRPGGQGGYDLYYVEYSGCR